MEQKILKKEVELNEDIEASVNKYDLTVKGPKGEVVKRLADKNITLNVDGNKIIVTAPKLTKKYKKVVNTFIAHIKNMIQGASEGFTYKLKICSGHFPMNVALNENLFSVKNLFGEKVPRELIIKEGAEVKIDNDIITVESVNKEIAGQVAADIETLTKRPGFDIRIFQDGIYITEKAGKELK